MKNLIQFAARYFQRKPGKHGLWGRLRIDAGNSSVELALVMSIFGIPFLVGTAECAFLAYDSIEVSNAANAGAMYGMLRSTNASESSQIIAAAQAEAPDLAGILTAAPTAYYACSLALGGTQYATQSAATTACSGTSNHPLQFIQVVTTAQITPPIKFPGFPAIITLNGSSVMEIEE